jgi:hypothetical protein
MLSLLCLVIVFVVEIQAHSRCIWWFVFEWVPVAVLHSVLACWLNCVYTRFIWGIVMHSALSCPFCLCCHMARLPINSCLHDWEIHDEEWFLEDHIAAPLRLDTYFGCIPLVTTAWAGEQHLTFSGNSFIRISSRIGLSMLSIGLWRLGKFHIPFMPFALAMMVRTIVGLLFLQSFSWP